VADPVGGQFGATSPQTAVAPSLNGAPMIKMRSFSVPIEAKTKTEIPGRN